MNNDDFKRMRAVMGDGFGEHEATEILDAMPLDFINKIADSEFILARKVAAEGSPAMQAELDQAHSKTQAIFRYLNLDFNPSTLKAAASMLRMSTGAEIDPDLKTQVDRAYATLVGAYVREMESL